jgi:hypothetical protein
MKQKLLKAIVLFGWFFAMRAPDQDVPGVFFTTLTGPFQTEAQCKAYKENTEDVITPLIPEIEFKECFSMEEA